MQIKTMGKQTETHTHAHICSDLQTLLNFETLKTPLGIPAVRQVGLQVSLHVCQKVGPT